VGELKHAPKSLKMFSSRVIRGIVNFLYYSGRMFFIVLWTQGSDVQFDYVGTAGRFSQKAVCSVELQVLVLVTITIRMSSYEVSNFIQQLYSENKD
jgi:hypothetical protein